MVTTAIRMYKIATATGQRTITVGMVRSGLFTSLAIWETEEAPESEEVSTPMAAARELIPMPGLTIWPNVTLLASIFGIPRITYRKIAIINSATIILLMDTVVLFPNHAMAANTNRRMTAAAVPLIAMPGNKG